MTSSLDHLAELFEQAVDLSASDQRAFLAGVADRAVANELQGLLRAHARPGAALDRAPELSHDEAEELFGPATPSDAATRDPVGTVIGGFRVLRKLGAGSMAEVYEAEQATPCRRVALKLLRWTGGGSSTAARRFSAEAETLGRLDHPHIARILDAGVHEAGQDGRAQSWLAMELIAEPLTITDYCAAKGLDLDARLRLFLPVCDAVHHAHRRGFLHRDLKPANVVVAGDDRDDPATAVRVIDFGIARLLSEQSLDLERTQAGELLGTVLYMSPEQAAGDHDQLDVRSDVYSLGVLLFELALGRHPHLHGDEPMLTALAKIRAVSVPELRGDPEVSADLAAILERALQPDPELRYDGAAELRDDLRRYLNSEPVSARRPEFLHRLRLFAKRRRALCSTLAGSALLAIAGLITIISLYVRSENAVADYLVAQHLADQKAADLVTAQGELRAVQERLANVGRSATSDLLETSSARLASTTDLLERRAIVVAAFDELERLRTTLLDNPDSQATLIKAYLSIGALHGSEWFAAEEEAAVGHRAFVSARELARRECALRPSAASLALLQETLIQYVHSCRKLEDRANGFAAADECVAVARSRLAAQPDDSDVAADFVAALWARSDLYIGQERDAQGIGDAEAALATALSGRERWGGARWRSLVGWSHFRLGAWLIHRPSRRDEGFEQLRLAGDLALTAYEEQPTEAMRQELRTQMALEIYFRLDGDPAAARERADVGMHAIERQGLDDPNALVSWTRFATLRYAATPKDQQPAVAAEIERRWARVSPQRLADVSSRTTDLVLELCQIGLGDRDGLRALFSATLRTAESAANTSEQARRLHERLQAAVPAAK